MPKNEEECMIVHKEYMHSIDFSDKESGPKLEYSYHCNINQRLCNLWHNGTCDKLILLNKTNDERN